MTFSFLYAIETIYFLFYNCVFHIFFHIGSKHFFNFVLIILIQRIKSISGKIEESYYREVNEVVIEI